MSEFEYLSVLVSIVIGLGLTHLLSGAGRMIHRRGIERPDPIHVIWSLATFVILVLNWWVFFQWRDAATWTFAQFLVVVLWAVAFYLMTVVLFPPDLPESEGYGTAFERNRPWFIGLLIASTFSDIALTGLRGDLLDPPHYLPFVAHLVVLGVIGLVVRSRRFHLFLASWVLFIALSWSFIVRRFLS